jgi:hypothetical protein
MDLLSKFKAALSDGVAPTLAVAPWATELTASFENEAARAQPRWPLDRCVPEQLQSGQEILLRSEADRTELVAAVIARLITLHGERRSTDAWARFDSLRMLTVRLLRPRLPFSEERLASIIEHCAANSRTLPNIPFRLLLRQVKHVAGDGGARGPLGLAVERLKSLTLQQPQVPRARANEISALATRVLSEAAESSPVLSPSPWHDRLKQDIDRLPDDQRESSERALAHAASAANKSKPSRAFLRAAGDLMAEDRTLAARVIEWVEAHVPDPAARDPNEDAIRALVWMLAAGSEELAPRIGQYCELCFRKVPNVGARSVKLGNAALQALGSLGGTYSIAELTRLRKRVRYPHVVRRIEAVLSDLASRHGMSEEQLEELSLPSYDLSANGERRLPVGDGMAIIRVSGTKTVTLTWARADGRETASVPKALKDIAPQAVVEAQRVRKEIESTLGGQAHRIESFYLSDRRIPFGSWRERYLEHPLVAGLVRRLIWRVETSAGSVAVLPRNGAIEDITGQSLALSSDANVSLWHPLHDKADRVLA